LPTDIKSPAFQAEVFALHYHKQRYARLWL